MSDLEVHRPKEYPTRKQPTDPISGGATAVLAVVAVRDALLLTTSTCRRC
jgi:hypothetical protein